jgi:hypothetical protein
MDSITTLIDFTKHVTDHTRDFAGREWIFKDINDWLAQSAGPRFYILTGEPGSGKTAIASRLYQFSQGTITHPDNLIALEPKFLSAVHFCWARDHLLIDPFAFTDSLSTQLANSSPAYLHILKQQLMEKREGRQSHIEVIQNVGTVIGGQVIGVLVKVSRNSAIDAFNRAVREPLEALFQSQPLHPQVVILVDALDESLLWKKDEDGIVSLITRMDYLSPSVRFIVTTRPENNVLQPLQHSQLEPVQLSLTSGVGLIRSLDDVKEHVLFTLKKTPLLASKLADDLSPETFASAIQGKSEGNFLYVDYVLQMLSTRQRKISQETLDEVPKGLGKMYIPFLKRLVGKRSWSSYARVLGTLAVAHEALTEKQLTRFVTTKEGVWPILQATRQFLEVDDALPADQRTYAIYHRSFADFLLDKDQANQYWCNEVDQHLRITKYYVTECPKMNWDISWGICDAYGLYYTAAHLAEAARGSEQPQRHEYTAQLVRLALSPRFQQARATELAELQRDLELTLRTVSADNHPLALPLVIKISLALVTFQRERLQPEQVFDLARIGDFKAAEERLRLLALNFAIDLEWQQAVLLTLAWLAAKKNPLDAKVLYDLVAKEPSNISILSLLMKRVEAALSDTGEPRAVLPPLPPAPSPYDVYTILARVGGRDDEGVLWNSGIGPINHTTAEVVLMEEPLLKEPFYSYEALSSADARPVYLAEQDSPPLVAYAVTNPDEGTEYVKQYLTIHAANTYVFYRNRSLWGILGAVLRHPDSNWVLEILSTLEVAALAGRSPEFQEGLPLTILALQAVAGQTNAEFTLESRAQEIRAEAWQLSGQREQGDSWGSHKRRLAALAQVYSLLQIRDAIAVDLLTQALHLPFGYAGFQALACLSLAEAIQACQVGDRVSIEDALLAAQNAAHNIQDPVFCARTTARFNALRDRWWRSPASGFDIVSAVEHFVHAPDAPGFAALHVIGERYGTRVQGPNKLPLPNWMLQADTLEVLAQVYRRPLVEFQRLNREQNWTPVERLPAGMQVNVPDPDFAPLLATRFSAEALATKLLSIATRVGLIQSLVPIASVNPTALDSVLARLLLAARPDDSRVLEDLAQTVIRYLNSLPETIRKGIEPRR